METSEIETYIQEYLVSLYLLKAVEHDRKRLAGFKLHRSWDAVFEYASLAAERRHIQIRKKLRAAGCRIVTEEMLDNRHLHVMYVYRKYEGHCYVMPMVLKARCEQLLMCLLAPLTESSAPAEPSM